MIQWNNLQKLLSDPGKKTKLSKATGISTGNISDWFNPNKPAQPSADALYKIAEFFECSVDYLMGLMDVEKIDIEPTTIYRFPVFRQEAAAGIGRLDVSNAYSMEEFIVDNIPNEAVFIMKIAGDSMYDEKTDQIKDNSVVVINPRDTLYEDKIVIANLDGEIVCKRYSKVDDHIEFLSDNQSRQDENKDSRDYRNPKVIGIVLGVIENEKFVLVK